MREDHNESHPHTSEDTNPARSPGITVKKCAHTHTNTLSLGKKVGTT